MKPAASRWSLPLPVAPWQTASAPTLRAISIWRLAISGARVADAEGHCEPLLQGVRFFN
jgi:hypothetical protein